MTSFERPVVPEVGIMTATSSGSRSSGPWPSGAASNSSSTRACCAGGAGQPEAPVDHRAQAVVRHDKPRVDLADEPDQLVL